MRVEFDIEVPELTAEDRERLSQRPDVPEWADEEYLSEEWAVEAVEKAFGEDTEVGIYFGIY